jgi:hypothetical protein
VRDASAELADHLEALGAIEARSKAILLRHVDER